MPSSQEAEPSAPPLIPRQRRSRRQTVGFAEDFRRFFVGGLKALLPTLITLSVIIWVWDLLWMNLGRHLIMLLKLIWLNVSNTGMLPLQPPGYIESYWSEDKLQTRIVGVLLAVVAVYFVGLIVGNLIGRTFWKLGERLMIKIPIIRAIYPAVKQVTDFVLADKNDHFRRSRVVAIRPHDSGIWSIGLVTGSGIAPLSNQMGEQMVTVFIPSSPTAFSGYVVVVPSSGVVDLPMSVEEAMRLLVSGGVIEPVKLVTKTG